MRDNDLRSSGDETSPAPEMIERICARIADGETLRQICVDSDMPSAGMVRRWLAREPMFARHYAAAILVRADLWGEEMVAIADAAAGGTRDEIAVARLRIIARQSLMTRILPKRNGGEFLLAPADDALTPESEDRIARAAARVQALLDKIEERRATAAPVAPSAEA